MNVAIIGYGYWGPNLVRNFMTAPGCQVSYVFDTSQKALDKVTKSYPEIAITQDLNEILKDSATDAVAIATPVGTHFELAKKALEQGKHVLLEKPMTAKLSEANELIRIADSLGLTLMVDHTYLYTESVLKMQQLIESGDIGNIQYIDSTRINLGLFQRDVNVLWDLAPHDISICMYLMQEAPIGVQATGVSHTGSTLANIAYLNLFYPNNKIAHFNCSWVSPVKIRQMLIGGDKKMILFNDLETTEKLRIYDKGYSILPDTDRERILIDYRIGDITIPKIGQGEALSAMVLDFKNAIENKTSPRSNSYIGKEVVRILEAAEKSILNKGQYMEL